MSRRRADRSISVKAASGAALRIPVGAPARRSILASWRQRCLVGQAMALALWNAPAFAQNIITPDGRTQTNVAVSGTTTTITTQTISGGAGYNSFSRFEQTAGTTVNMHLPQNTGALVNIVRDGPVVVNGILNSYRNGQIGGHIYFSDSAGFTVGPSGVINTGQLTVNTPTREFLDQVIGANGVVNEGLAARLRANDVPISPDGRISIDGTINARRGVTLHGQSVSVAGQIRANAAPVDIAERRQRHREAFAQSVNTVGLSHGGAMVARKGGGIEIVAAGTASVSGRLSANATARRAAGTVAIRSGKGTTIAATAQISASGMAPAAGLANASSGAAAVNTAEGGKVSITSQADIAIARGALIDVSAAQGVAGKGGSAIVFADTNLNVESGALFRGTAGTSGDGGFLELSAKDTVTLGAIDVDLSARNGTAGLLYIDPANIVIGTGGSANVILNGTDALLEATNSITIAGDGIVDTRKFDRGANGGVMSATNPSTGNSGNITLIAPSITVRGKLLAGVSEGSSYSAGDVTLNASQSQTLIAGMASASAGIKVSGTITGRDIKMTADARAKSSYSDPNAGTLAALAAQTVGGLMFGLNGGYVGSTVSAKIEIEDGADIKATRDVKLLANGVQEATLPAITISGNFPWGAAVSIGEILGEVKADVASGAKITVGRNLDVNAFNDVNLMATALTVTTGSSLVAATVAYGAVDVATSAKVHSGAIITGATTSNINVSAGNSNTFSTSATAMASAGSVGGIAFAYSDYKASADAQFGASLGTSGAKVGSLTVQATSDTEKNATSASTTVGNNALFNAGPTGSTVSDLLTQIFGKLKTGTSSVPAKVGSAIAVANSDLRASATIAADTGSTAPSIYASGNVVVAARQRDFAVRVIADSSTNSNSKDPTAANPSADISLSFGIGVGEFKHKADGLDRRERLDRGGAHRRRSPQRDADRQHLGELGRARRGLLAHQRQYGRRQQYPDDLCQRLRPGVAARARRRDQLFPRRQRELRLCRERGAPEADRLHRGLVVEPRLQLHPELGPGRPYRCRHGDAQHRRRRQFRLHRRHHRRRLGGRRLDAQHRPQQRDHRGDRRRRERRGDGPRGHGRDQRQDVRDRHDLGRVRGHDRAQRHRLDLGAEQPHARLDQQPRDDHHDQSRREGRPVRLGLRAQRRARRGRRQRRRAFGRRDRRRGGDARLYRRQPRRPVR